MSRIDAFFKLMSEQSASDLHLSTNNPPMLRIHGELVRVNYPPLQNDDLKAMVYEIAPEVKIKVFEETNDVDFGYEVPGVARYRANFFQQKYGISAVFRSIPSNVQTLEELNLPPVLKKFPLLKKGLVLATGPTDHPGRDGGLCEPQAPGPHHYDRRSNRVCPSQPELSRESSRSRGAYTLVRFRFARRPP
jgi:twitching motility protein PilT